MQVVFMNTFDRVDGEQNGNGAHVSICEHEGAWMVLWTEEAMSEADQGGEDVATWYEGTSWEEMLASFRHGIAMKMGEGYSPIIDSMLEEKKGHQGGIVAMMQCYGELHADEALYEELREWRRRTAANHRKSAYMVATNRMLWMISAFKPHEAKELAQIPGWGEAKQNAYAEDLLAVTAKFERETTFPLDWVTQTLDSKVFMQWLYKQKELKYKGQMTRHQEKRQILQAISEGRTLAELQAELEMNRRHLIERIEQLESEGYDMASIMQSELSEMPDEEQQSVLQAFEAVGDKYLKPVMQHVYGEEGMADRPLDQIYDRLRFLRMAYRRNKKHEAV
ncbi:HRDC domain protein [Paenibacillus curdlanolyticus YK9]|uniref:HRDC domain protein n=1 Tax=Paenibacillus curdlanolyticus YK9 TaxID=717606 RepID=E0I6C3_9BACL|nr:HRDC domain-containing protein [Paenibacillus curdlanolyticus]EFM11589.1 HRDC domain protein [Paenibacillus curdlanolyticus YK9]